MDSVRYAADGSISGFRILGFATGEYANTCRSCGKQFIGDKRAVQCLECVIKLVEEKFTPTNSDYAAALKDIYECRNESDKLLILIPMYYKRLNASTHST
jgi:hypothetical protein